MSQNDEFDGYRKWLGITSRSRPPSHYDLLGIKLNEDDHEVILAAAEQRRFYIESKRGIGHEDQVAEILMRIGEAEITLLNNDLRREYDRQLNLFEKRRKSRQVDPNVVRAGYDSKPGRVIGEDNGIVKTFAGIVAVLCVVFAVMAVFAFKVLPWSKPSNQAEATPPAVPGVTPVMVPVSAPAHVVPPAQVAKVPAELAPKLVDVVATSIPIQDKKSSEINIPPEGFEALFNGIDFTNWSEGRPDHWSVENGILKYDGYGTKDKNLVSAKTYGDFEMLVDWKIAPGTDSGIYLRGKPQIQIKDDVVGSGGLYNNRMNPNHPKIRADKVVGEWNTFHISMRGDRVTIHLNEQLVVDNVILENYPSYVGTIPRRGPIEFQQHTGAIEFRNIFMRELTQSPISSQLPAISSNNVLVPPRSAGEREKEILLLKEASLAPWEPSPAGEKSNWSLKSGILRQIGKGSSLVTNQKFEDFDLHLEFKLPSKCNSGIYLRGRYEVQLLDSDFRNKAGQPAPPIGSTGAIWGKIAPTVNVYKGPNTWNILDVRLVGREVTVRLNESLVIDAQLIEGVTGQGFLDQREAEPGPILLQSAEVIGAEFRNIRIKPIRGLDTEPASKVAPTTDPRQSNHKQERMETEQLRLSETTRITFSESDHKIDVLVGNTVITSYLFADILPRPALHPLQTPSGIVVTRGYPMADGESNDHPNHVGVFIAADGVNENNFWSTTSSDHRIAHLNITKAEGGSGYGILSTTANWIANDGKALLEETRDMKFRVAPDAYVIDFTITLKAVHKKVVFADPKEALFGIRLADWMRVESEQPQSPNGFSGQGTGKYLNSNGAKTEKDVWGRRAKWLRVEATKDGKTAGVVVFDHPQSVNHPTYWHARGYGLLAANPIGQQVFEKAHNSSSVKPLNLTITPDKSATFRYRVLVYDGSRTKEQIDREFTNFATNNPK